MNNMLDRISSNDILLLLPVLLGGILLGIIFFAGLYWTVQLGMKSTHPALCFLGSFLLRTTITLSGIYLLTDGQWPRLLACMLGFIGIRFAVTAITMHPLAERAKKQESRHAP